MTITYCMSFKTRKKNVSFYVYELLHPFMYVWTLYECLVPTEARIGHGGGVQLVLLTAEPSSPCVSSWAGWALCCLWVLVFPMWLLVLRNTLLSCPWWTLKSAGNKNLLNIFYGWRPSGSVLYVTHLPPLQHQICLSSLPTCSPVSFCHTITLNQLPTFPALLVSPFNVKIAIPQSSRASDSNIACAHSLRRRLFRWGACYTSRRTWVRIPSSWGSSWA